jgi:hypothetical protein
MPTIMGSCATKIVGTFTETTHKSPHTPGRSPPGVREGIRGNENESEKRADFTLKLLNCYPKEVADSRPARISVEICSQPIQIRRFVAQYRRLPTDEEKARLLRGTPVVLEPASKSEGER